MDDERKRKQKFAELLLANPGEPFQAALAVFPEDAGRALQIAQVWANEDSEVREICEELRNKHGERHFLPTKETIAREVLEIGRITDAEIRARLAAYRLVAEVLGYIEKPAQQTNVNVSSTSYRVMQTKHHGTDAEWEQRAVEQQKQLIENASARTTATKH